MFLALAAAASSPRHCAACLIAGRRDCQSDYCAPDIMAALAARPEFACIPRYAAAPSADGPSPFDVACYLFTYRGELVGEPVGHCRCPRARHSRHSTIAKVRDRFVTLAVLSQQMYDVHSEAAYLRDFESRVSVAVCAGATPADFHALTSPRALYERRECAVGDEILALVVGPRALLALAREGLCAGLDLGRLAAHVAAAFPGRTPFRRAEDELAAAEFVEFVGHLGYAAILTAILVDGGRYLAPVAMDVGEHHAAADAGVDYDINMDGLWAMVRRVPIPRWVGPFGAAFCEALARGRRVERLDVPTVLDVFMDRLEDCTSPGVRADMARGAIRMALAAGLYHAHAFPWLRVRVSRWLP